MTDINKKQSGNMPELIEPKLNRTQKIVSGLIEQNYSPAEIARILRMHPTHIYRVKQKVERYKIATDPKIMKACKQAALKAVQDFNENKKGARASDALKVVEMVQDRIDPAVKRTENLNINADVSVFDLMQYRNKDIQDVVNDNNPDGQ